MLRGESLGETVSPRAWAFFFFLSLYFCKNKQMSVQLQKKKERAADVILSSFYTNKERCAIIAVVNIKPFQILWVDLAN
jgi:hypothetical protein